MCFLRIFVLRSGIIVLTLADDPRIAIISYRSYFEGKNIPILTYWQTFRIKTIISDYFLLKIGLYPIKKKRQNTPIRRGSAGIAGPMDVLSAMFFIPPDAVPTKVGRSFRIETSFSRKNIGHFVAVEIHA